MLLRVIPRAGGAKVLPASFHAFLAADAYPLIDNPGVGTPLLLHLQGSYRAGFEAGRVRTLMANLGLIIAAQDFLLHDDPGEGRGISASAVEISANDLADAAPRAERFIRQDHSFRQGHFLSVGEGENLKEVPHGHHASQAESAKGDALQYRAPVDVFGHLPFIFRSWLPKI
jgi:hypothetical protein